LLAAFVYDYYNKYLESGEKSPKAMAWISATCLVLLMAYGYSINILYASIGNNDGVEFDLDGAKSRLFTPVIFDNSQKEFYGEAKTILQGVDSVYLPSGGEGIIIPQFYLGQSRIFDLEFLKRSLEISPSAKYVIIDRTGFPLGLEKGRKELDSLGVQRNLLLKKGEYELYLVFR